MPKPITILVEGESDRAAVVSLAPRLGVDLEAEQITVTVIGGAGNFGRAIPDAVAQGHRVGGLYDEAEERFVAGALNRQEGEDLTRQGFFACRPDLELELVRAIGAVEMTPLLEAHGDLATFRNFQDQPKYREADVLEQLRRFIGANGARKAKYAALMAEAVDFGSVPEPLEGLVNWVWSA
ncbi:TOPRIM nucleotidyl transferase/hydrolase domain-containing protein [Nocardioides ochotonae]|uniref:TOPRIM nucleotidyl transferase/hydrolase domain-containing protein n=1 Tax=Nocardioides ochotonae TaxID=2685869 RepID=UPI0014081669|nr:TOPRIM nucleotidyl transferase/hydrolase domain-containing protein [Nocardioides ochotonae]